MHHLNRSENDYRRQKTKRCEPLIKIYTESITYSI